jgi:hypothetical protein
MVMLHEFEHLPNTLNHIKHPPQCLLLALSGLTGDGFGGSSTSGGVSLTNTVSQFLRCCSANLSQAFAMPSMARLLFWSLNV